MINKKVQYLKEKKSFLEVMVHKDEVVNLNIKKIASILNLLKKSRMEINNFLQLILNLLLKLKIMELE